MCVCVCVLGEGWISNALVIDLSRPEFGPNQRFSSSELSRVPTHLENLDKQGQTWKTWKNRGFWGKKKKILQKKIYILQNLKKNLTSPQKSPKASIEKVSEKNPTQGRGPRFFFLFLDKGLGIIGFYWNFKNIVLI